MGVVLFRRYATAWIVRTPPDGRGRVCGSLLSERGRCNDLVPCCIMCMCLDNIVTLSTKGCAPIYPVHGAMLLLYSARNLPFIVRMR